MHTSVSKLEALFRKERLPSALLELISTLHEPLAERIASAARDTPKPFVVGICGAQGSGKSTLVQIVSILLHARDVSTAILSLDDVYLTRSERTDLASRTHPMFRTRGVPGTHDIELASRVFDALAQPGSTALPRFDKSQDDRLSSDTWPRIATPTDVLLFEGWCVGAVAQDAAALSEPINDLERKCDPNGTWRRYANDTLATEYQRLFARIDLLILLQAPDFDAVYEWRKEQELKLSERLIHEGQPSRVMNDEELRDFIAHYERLTRHILAEMPARAGIVIELDAHRAPVRVRGL